MRKILIIFLRYCGKDFRLQPECCWRQEQQGLPYTGARTHWCRAQGEGACAAVDPLVGKRTKLRQCVFLHAQLHIRAYLGGKAAHFLL